ncbi:hypothetical protein BJ170DRAFT_114728 [Xylariales sp. AK1849]|nr:hypothetical protein BJ170DRAFT_114728 [Xylariales sp. AK1849]
MSSQASPAPPGGKLATPLKPGTTYENPLIHNVALGVTPIALGSLFLPPRRLDLRMVILGSCAVWGIFQLRYDYTGRSFGERMGKMFASLSPDSLPAKAQETQRRIRDEKARRERARALEGMEGLSASDRARLAELEARTAAAAAAEEGKAGRGTLESIWMGDADDDWKQKRAKREAEALQEGGGGIWGLIVDQVSEVFTAGDKKVQEAQRAKEQKVEGGDDKSS